RELTMCEFFDSNTGNFNYESFKAALFGPGYNSVPHLDSAMKLLELVFANLKTALPGIAFLSVKFIFNSLIKARENNNELEKLWERLNFHLMSEMFTRKKSSMDKKFCLLSSVHVLTPPCALKTANERGEVATRKVNEHYFYFESRYICRTI
ncbi:MAG: hypothetical protein EB127_31630, partial [Alphaproteobacteria bacterium]|nr:hypothetical protein [Alphaproteobacteria bacterium]